MVFSSDNQTCFIVPYQVYLNKKQQDSDRSGIRVLFSVYLFCICTDLDLRSVLAQVVFHRPERLVTDIMLDPAGVVRGGFVFLRGLYHENHVCARGIYVEYF